jgi:hypothetical protein
LEKTETNKERFRGAIWKMAKITAIEMARKAKINPRLFFEVLRDENSDWHKHKDRWTDETGTEEHRAMQRVLRLVVQALIPLATRHESLLFKNRIGHLQDTRKGSTLRA